MTTSGRPAPIERVSFFHPQEMALRDRIGAHKLHATHDPRDTTRNARAAFESRWEKLADPDGTLDPRERARRAKHLRAAHFARLALKSAQARRARAQRRNGGGK